MNILMVKLSAVGDVVHTLPSLTALREGVPDAHITWVVEQGAADLLRNHPHCDRILVSSRKAWVDHLRRGREVRRTVFEMGDFLRQLRDRRYDLAIDFHGLFKSAVLIGASRADRKIGYRSMQELSRFFYHEMIPEDMGKHAVLRYLDFVRYLGIVPGEPRFIMALEAQERRRVEELLAARGIARNAPFIAVSPLALWETKLWYNDRFSRLCDRISRELSLPVVFTGAGAQARAATDHIRAAMDTESVDVAGSTTLRELACLYERATLVVTTDSGPMHVAAAMNTPTVALFGPTDPDRTGPFGKGHLVVCSGAPCSPCFLKRCSHMTCMRDITVDSVFEAVREQLSQVQSGEETTTVPSSKGDDDAHGHQ